MPATKWITKVAYLDTETGEALTRKEAKQQYIIIKTEKYVDKQITGTWGKYHEYINIRGLIHHCRRSAQLDLF